eukprot:2651283-Amphidinium_carterae.1
MNPPWVEELQKGSAKNFTELFLKWESHVFVYELQRGRPLDANVKVAVAMRHAAHARGYVKTALRHAPQSGRDYDRMGVCVCRMRQRPEGAHSPLIVESTLNKA